MGHLAGGDHDGDASGVDRYSGAACKPRGGCFTRGVNLFALRWLWLGLKGNSVTFAALFASVALGWSLSRQINVLLARLGVHWLFVLILPMLFFGWLAKNETRFIPDEQRRRRWARTLIAGSLAVALLIGWTRKP
jgi:hypothetical protein